MSASKQKELDEKFQEMLTMAEAFKPKPSGKKSPSNEEADDDIIFKVKPDKANEDINKVILLA